jgi:hypothetical protein
MVLRAGRRAVTDLILIAILVAFFALAIVLVQVLGRMIDRDTDPDALADEPPDTGAGPRPSLDGRPGGPR